jgi:aryl-alcohol dehydrogenase-like predicted oxidoreductase
MKTQPIPDTDLRPSCICLGTATFGSSRSEKESFELLDAYFEAGGNFLDTAHNYADWARGFEDKCVSEVTLGKWLHERKNRDRIVLGTKGGCCDLRTYEPRSSREEIVGQLDRSLKNLGVDCIDLYWLHRDDPSRPVAHFVDLLNEQKQKGKIRHFGCSNWTAARIRAAAEYARANGLRSFVANQMWWSLAVPNLGTFGDKTVVQMDPAGREYHTRTGLAAIPYSSQGGGFFIKLSRLAASERPDFLKNHLYHTPENLAKFERVKKLASDRSSSITAIELSYLLSQPFPTIPIVGCRTTAQLGDSLKAADVTLTPEMIRFLDG